jgi:hypothetical protein
VDISVGQDNVSHQSQGPIASVSINLSTLCQPVTTTTRRGHTRCARYFSLFSFSNHKPQVTLFFPFQRDGEEGDSSFALSFRMERR